MVTLADVPGVIDVGLKLTVTPVGAFAVSATAFLPVPLSVTLSVKVAVSLTCTVPVVAEAVSAKSGPVLVPPPHAVTSSAPSTDPKPVARLYVPPLAVNPATPERCCCLKASREMDCGPHSPADTAPHSRFPAPRRPSLELRAPSRRQTRATTPMFLKSPKTIRSHR